MIYENSFAPGILFLLWVFLCHDLRKIESSSLYNLDRNLFNIQSNITKNNIKLGSFLRIFRGKTLLKSGTTIRSRSLYRMMFKIEIAAEENFKTCMGKNAKGGIIRLFTLKNPPK